MKNCSKCKEIKSKSEFNKDKSSKSGLTSQCVVCISEKYQLNKEKYLEKDKLRYKVKKDEILLKIKKYQNENSDYLKQYQKLWYINNKDKLQLQYHDNREKHLIYQNQYNIDNKINRSLYMKEYQSTRRKTDINYKLQGSLHSRVSSALKGNFKGDKTFNLIGCDIEEFKKRIEIQFKPEMSWSNWGDIWEIDHIKPCDLFDLTKEEEQKLCFHFSNQQPLFKTTKIAKSFGYINEIGNRNKSNNYKNE